LQLSNLLHQRLSGRHLLFSEVMTPRHPGSKITNGTEFLEPESLLGRGLIVGVEPFHPPKGLFSGVLRSK
jgi:hypothetical protein